MKQTHLENSITTYTWTQGTLKCCKTEKAKNDCSTSNYITCMHWISIRPIAWIYLNEFTFLCAKVPSRKICTNKTLKEYNKRSPLTVSKTACIEKWPPHVLRKEQAVHVHVSWPSLYKYTAGRPISTEHATRKNGPLQRRRQQSCSSAPSCSQISAWG